MQILWIQVAKVISIPTFLGILAYAINLHWLIGVPAILIASFLGYAKLNVMTKQDIRDLTDAILQGRLPIPCTRGLDG